MQAPVDPLRIVSNTYMVVCILTLFLDLTQSLTLQIIYHTHSNRHYYYFPMIRSDKAPELQTHNYVQHRYRWLDRSVDQNLSTFIWRYNLTNIRRGVNPSLTTLPAILPLRPHLVLILPSRFQYRPGHYFIPNSSNPRTKWNQPHKHSVLLQVCGIRIDWKFPVQLRSGWLQMLRLVVELANMASRILPRTLRPIFPSCTAKLVANPLLEKC
ncbi:hypothetical protein BDV96DRAFT_15005 [Lophiotrema nucula]|uniref:Uncharacterized protein n=1 Tax=Lophiotrema nucula TaxID=690887 RepID=A0A6A5ZV40_9PLEO|nr:hypothetical protein BDV96DRAFT_15005 [Lophiotrema nucula]